ncbi:MAG: type VI secretion system tip protein VgrG [Bacteroidota bacterium]|nr:type VI secretion system tip protein VgrG [Bacteroidota bacterium]
MANDRNIPENVKGAAVTFTVKINGNGIPKTFEVYSLNILREANRIPSARITLVDGSPSKEKFSASNDALFVPGQSIELLAGRQSKEDLLFKGVIIAHSIALRKNGNSQLKLECRDVAFQMTQGKNSAHFTDVKDSDIANTLLAKYKITAGTIEDTSYKHADMMQFDSSDWDFLLKRMDINSKLVFVNDGKIDIKGPDFSMAAALALQYGATIHEFDAEMDVRNQYAAAKVLSWDPANQEIVDIDGQSPSAVKQNGNISSDDLAKVTGLKTQILRHGGNVAREELQAWANACRQKSLLAKIRGRVSFDGFAGVKPGDLIELKGLGDRFNGKVFVSGVKHEVSNGGWTTTAQFGMDPAWMADKLNAETSSPDLVPSVRGLHIAVVEKLEKDPKGEDRIQVKVPMVNINEGLWARIATMDAGDKRGSFFRPDRGDEVLVGFINDDPRNAIVLGMMNSSKKPAPLTAKDDNPEKGFFFASKMKMLFHEKDKSMTFETPGGNKFIMSEKDKGITLQDQNGNKLVLNKDGITLESKKKLILKSSGGDIESEGMNIKQTAKSQFKAEGSAGIELTSSAVAKLKGSIVQIN